MLILEDNQLVSVEAMDLLLEKGMNTNQVLLLDLEFLKERSDIPVQAKIELDRLEARVIRSCEILTDARNMSRSLGPDPFKV